VRAAVYYQNDDVRIEERPVPEVGPGEFLIRIHASGICGSDLMEWYRKPKAPLVLGHEIAGTVEEVGLGAARFAPGDRVVVTHHVPCNTCRPCLRGHHSTCDTLRSTHLEPGGFAEFARVPALQADRGTIPIPDGVTFEEASFSEPLGCVVHGLARAGMRPGTSVAVIGSGMAGLLFVSLCRALGAGPIFATDVRPERLAAARRLGADFGIDAAGDVPASVRDENDGEGADLVAVCVAHPDAIRDGLRAAGRGGTVLLFAPPAPDLALPLPLFALWRDDVSVTTSYAAAPHDLEVALTLIRGRRVPVADLITHALPLEQAQEGFRLVEHGADSLKVILLPQKRLSE
jgi:L-iditol 2-dehydrogenase